LFTPLFFVLAFLSAKEGLKTASDQGFQEKVSAVVWIIGAAVCAQLLLKGSLLSSETLPRLRSFFDRSYVVRGQSFGPIQFLAALAVAYFVGTGVAAEIPMARQNLISGAIKLQYTPEIQAARWVESHTDRDATIACRGVPLVHYYSKRKVIWFPPITDAKVLMKGIRDHHVGYVVVVDRKFSYYLPTDKACFDLLARAYPSAFRLVEKNSQLSIYQVQSANLTN